MEDGFSRYTLRTIVTPGVCVGKREIIGGESQQATLLAHGEFQFPLASEEVPELVLSGPDFAVAPVVQGGDAGWAYILLDGKTVGKVPLVYGETVEQKKPEKKTHFWEKWFGGTA